MSYTASMHGSRQGTGFNGSMTGFQNSNNQQLEDKLAKELQRIKLENESKARAIEKICAESDELRGIKEKLKSAYVSKERAAQIAETHIRKLDELKTEAEVEDLVLQHSQKQEELERQKEYERSMIQLGRKEVLMKQMEEKKAQSAEAYEQYLKERDQVDVIISKIIAEDRSAMETDKRKKVQTFQDMVDTLADKAQRRIHEKQKEKNENQKYKEFTIKKDAQEAEQKKARAELEAIKDKIFQRLKAEEEQRQKEKELLEDLRAQLYQEEFDANERKKDRMEKEKRVQQKEQMIEAEREAHAFKLARKQEEERMETEFRIRMLDKFANDDKLEQMNAQKRRMKELEHKREVERLWQEKLAIYREEREQELEEERRKKEEERWREEVIRQEKERLLREHLPNIEGFLPKGLLQNEKDKQLLTKTKFR
jgi:hypothetical protein